MEDRKNLEVLLSAATQEAGRRNAPTGFFP
jgi:hypothetical protein